jgi:hypothetical protein
MGLCPYLKYIKIKRSNRTRATTKKRGEELEPKLMKQKKKQKGWKLLHNQKAAHSSGCAQWRSVLERTGGQFKAIVLQ